MKRYTEPLHSVSGFTDNDAAFFVRLLLGIIVHAFQEALPIHVSIAIKLPLE